MRRDLLAELLGHVGGGTTVRSDVHRDYGYRIAIGPYSFVNRGAVFRDTGPITLGEAVQPGPGVQLRVVHDRRPLIARLGDKLATKEYASVVCPDLRVPRVLWTGTDVGELARSELPQRWVL